MELDYNSLMDDSQQISAYLDELLEESPKDEDLKETQEFLADRYKTLLFLCNA